MCLVVRQDGKSRFSVPKGDSQQDKIQRAPEVEVVLSDVSETMSRWGEASIKSALLDVFIVAVDVFDLICVLCLFTERLQMSLHVRVPPEAAAAGLRGPEQVHGLFLRVSSLMKKKEKHVCGVCYASEFTLVSCFSQWVQKWVPGAAQETFRWVLILSHHPDVCPTTAAAASGN